MAAYEEKPTQPAHPEKPGHPEQPPQEDGRCSKIATEVAAYLERRAKRQNQMKPCEGEQKPFKCEPLRIPDLAPWTRITWGDSKCDCIESDDTEIMYVTVCNPYENLTLSGLTVELLEVVDANNKPVAVLPDKTPSIQVVPVGPYCFGDIPPCSCVTRQFLVRLRGAMGGKYKLRLRGMCFDACIHGDTEDCFTFEVCQD